MALSRSPSGLITAAAYVIAVTGAFSIPIGAHAALDEITVVAQKKSRAENLQDVPAAIAAFPGDDLDARLFQKLDDLSYTIPNVQLETVGTFPGVQNFSIRGQGINSSIPSVDPTVGLFVDGVYIGTSFGTVLDTWDLESVEVLRGPQGLLFGRNVTGGAVTVRTARPDPAGELGVRARALTTDEGRYNVSAAIEAPLIQDTLAAKLMVYYDDDDGYFENQNPSAPPPVAPAGSLPFTYYLNPATGGDTGALETTLVRPSFVWTPIDTMELTLIAEVGETEGDGAPWAAVTSNPLIGVGGQRDGTQAEFTTTSDEIGKTEIDWTQVTFEFNWDILGGTLTNIMGYREAEVISFTDVDGTYLPIFSGGGSTDQDQFSNELRWSGNALSNWETTIGLYYLTQDIGYLEQRWLGLDTGTGMPMPTQALQLGGELEADNYGIFWNNDIYIGEQVVLTAGIRYSEEDKDATILDAGCVDVDGPGEDGMFDYSLGGTGLACNAQDLSGDYDYWTPKLGARWRFLDNAQAYAFWTKGFRAGGFNFRNARPDVIPPGPTREEEQNSYEVGIKTELFNNTLRLNAAYFLNKIDDIQRELNLGDPLVVVLQGTVNAGDAEISGVEIEFTAVPTDRFTIYGSLGYLDGKYTRVDPDYASFLGSELPRLAPWSASLGGSLDIPIDEYGYITVRGDWGFRDRNAYDDSNLNIFEQQRRYSASVQWTSPEEAWKVSLFGKNLSDQANYGNLTSIGGLYTSGPMQKGREYGLEVQYQL